MQQSILLVDNDIDVAFELSVLLGQLELPISYYRVSDFQALSDAIQIFSRSLVIIHFKENAVDDWLTSIVEVQWPKPVIVILDTCHTDLMVKALRAGVSDIFFLDSIGKDSEQFLKSAVRLLGNASIVDENVRNRQELEKSLLELQTDQIAAYHVQKNLLPEDHIEANGLTFNYELIPSLYLSGDFVDFLRVDDDTCFFYLADVSGHGASSALLTVLLKHMTSRMLRSLKRGSNYDLLSPRSMLKRLNKELIDLDTGKHVSMVIGVIDTKRQLLTYAVGGHHPMPLMSDKHGTRYLPGCGMSVGLFPDPMFDEQKVPLEDKFQLTIFSDGILEMASGEGFASKEAHICEVVDKMRFQAPATLREGLLACDMEVAPDDIAIMTVFRR